MSGWRRPSRLKENSVVIEASARDPLNWLPIRDLQSWIKEVWVHSVDSSSLNGEKESDATMETEDLEHEDTDDEKNSQLEVGSLVKPMSKTLKPRPPPVSYNRQVKFSSSPRLRDILKHPEPHHDSGIGSSSSGHSGPSGRDRNIQSNTVNALREALADAIKNIDYRRSKYQKESNEQTETRRKHQDTETLYLDAIERNQIMQAQVESMEDRLEKQVATLELANPKIRDLESDVSEWKDRYKKVHEFCEAERHSTDASVISAGFRGVQ
ncbi:hypothetical protein F5B21DRAFT_522690 [Xylaria acuta]|nr:hypothetical protein F5B21DRAFT_522690 [Xylaria acuta]